VLIWTGKSWMYEDLVYEETAETATAMEQEVDGIHDYFSFHSFYSIHFQLSPVASALSFRL
jgi:hypothetical protein